MKSQDEIFLDFEGDNWYERNKGALKANKDIPLLLIDIYNIKPKRVLEVGASNGYRLAKIYEKYGSEVYAVEPSEKAINVDKVLKLGGYLIIGDFQVPFPIKVRYHHIKDMNVFAFKVDYKRIFLATGFYKEIATLSLNHDAKLMTGETSIDNYFSVSLLRKEDTYTVMRC